VVGELCSIESSSIGRISEDLGEEIEKNCGLAFIRWCDGVGVLGDLLSYVVLSQSLTSSMMLSSVSNPLSKSSSYSGTLPEGEKQKEEISDCLRLSDP
jgi:hypothetical protein